MTDGSFIPVGMAGQKVVVDLDSRRPAARKLLMAQLEDSVDLLEKQRVEKANAFATQIIRGMCGLAQYHTGKREGMLEFVKSAIRDMELSK